MSDILSRLFTCAYDIVMKRPILAIYDVTKQCNQCCPMCNIHKTESFNMSLEETEKKANILRNLGVRYVYLQGGEPLLRKDIIDIVDIFLDNDIKPTIITNGALLTNELIKKIAERNCNLSISIDSLNKEKYAFLRGADCLDIVLKNVKKASEITERKGNFSITSTITAESNFEDIRNIEKFAAENGFMYVVRPYISTKGFAGKRDDRLIYTPEDVLEIFEYYLKKAKKENYLAYLVYNEHIRYIKGEKMPLCDALKYSFLLKETGALAPCIELCDTEIDIDSVKGLRRQQKEKKQMICSCNSSTPCFYNDAREIGILVRNIPKIILHGPEIIYQCIRYTSFF